MPRAEITYKDVEAQRRGGEDTYETCVLRALTSVGFTCVLLRPEHRKWLENMAGFEQIQRRSEFTPEKYAELVIRHAYAADPTKGGTVGGDSGLRDRFDGEKWER